MPAYRLKPDITAPPGDLVVGDAAGRGQSWIYLGTIAEAGPRRLLKLDVTAEQVIAVLGKRGTGKSYTLGVLLEGLGSSQRPGVIGQIQGSRATLLLDVLDIFWSSALPLQPSIAPELQRQYERMERSGLSGIPIGVDVWVPAGYQNPEIDPAATQVLRIAPSDLTAEDWGTLFEIDLVSEPRGMLLEELVRKVSVSGWADIGGQRKVPVPLYGFPELLECLDQDPDLQNAYAPNTIRSIKQRLGAQAVQEMFQGMATPLSTLLQPGRVSVLMLARTSDATKRVITSIVARRILRERRNASFARKRLDLDPNLSQDERRSLGAVAENGLPRTWLLVDEAQVLAPSEERTLSGEALVKYAKEGRNYGLSLAITSQQPTAVDSRLMSQVETLLVHQLTVKADIDVALRSAKSQMPEEIRVDNTDSTPDGLIRALQQGDAFFSCANGGRTLGRACVVRVRPRVTAHGGYEA